VVKMSMRGSWMSPVLYFRNNIKVPYLGSTRVAPSHALRQQQLQYLIPIPMANYKTRRSQTDVQQKAVQFNDQMLEDKAQLEADIRATDKQIRESKRKVEKALSAVPFQVSEVLNAEAEVESYERGLKRMQEILVSEFEGVDSTTA